MLFMNESHTCPSYFSVVPGSLTPATVVFHLPALIVPVISLFTFTFFFCANSSSNWRGWKWVIYIFNWSSVSLCFFLFVCFNIFCTLFSPNGSDHTKKTNRNKLTVLWSIDAWCIMMAIIYFLCPVNQLICCLQMYHVSHMSAEQILKVCYWSNLCLYFQFCLSSYLFT